MLGQVQWPYSSLLCGCVHTAVREHLQTTAAALDIGADTVRVPFLCLVCTQQAHKVEVQDLKSEIATLKLKLQDFENALSKLPLLLHVVLL